jgi:iron(III) transport system permease protein
LTFVVIFFIVAGVMPLLAMLVKCIAPDGVPALDAFSGLLTSPRNRQLMQNSLCLALLVTLFAVSAGTPAGIVLGKTDIPFRRSLLLLFLLPLLVPPYIMAVSWSCILGPEGLLAGFAGKGAAAVATRFLFGLPGCVLVMSSIFMPVPMLVAMTFARETDPALEEAGRIITGWPGVLKNITIPLMMPGIIMSAILVFILAFGEFSVPAFLRYDVFPVESFIRFSAFYDFRSATAAAMPLVVVACLLPIIERRVTWKMKRGSVSMAPRRDAGRVYLIRTGRMGRWLLLLLVLTCLVTVVLPVVTLVVRSGSWKTVFEAVRMAGDSMARSVVYAASGTSLLLFTGFFTGYVIHSRLFGYWSLLDAMTLFLFVLPGTVTGIGLISLWNTEWTNFIYGTPLIIMMGYVARYTAVTARIAVASLSGISPSMEEAARSAGAGWFRRMFFVVIPLAGRGLAAAWLAGYIFCLRDTSVTMLVYPPGHDTLPVRIFTLMANGSPELVAALCVIMTVITIIPAAFLFVLRPST